MKNRYIKIEKIYNKLKLAEAQKQPLYICGPLGLGKTAAVQYYYRNKEARWLSGENGFLSDTPEIIQITEETIIIDDISWLKNERDRQYINDLIKNGKKHIVMIGRARLPEWLKTACIENQMLIADYLDLQLNAKETEKLLESYQVKASKEEIDKILQDSQGQAIFIIMIAYHMQNKENYGEVIKNEATIDLFHYFNQNMYDKWSVELRDMLSVVSYFDEFDAELAEMVSGNRHAYALINEALEIGDFLIVNDNKTFSMFKKLKMYFLWRQTTENDIDKQNVILTRGALYYEIHEQMNKALFYYNKAGKVNEIKRLLCRNAELHVGIGQYYDTMQYYMKLPEEEIMKTPVLMAGLSMIYSLTLQTDKSEKWYQKLREYENDNSRTKEEKKEAQRRLLYLDIALPHRGIIKMIDLLKKAAVIITDKQMSIPEFSVTNNSPSIMNGGKDFCEWSKSDKELARVMKKPIELVLGNWGAGLVNISLAESQFEKGADDLYEIMTLLNTGYTKADLCGKIEMCFVATALLCRIHTKRNQIQVARNQLLEFKKKAIAEASSRLIPNIEAMENWFDLLEGKIENVKQWLEKAPNENQDFIILNRYQYLMKIRSYLFCNRNEEAVNLIERLLMYAKEYKRTYIEMECEILKAIAQYRLKIGNYQETIKEVLPKIESYHFIDIIAKEGIAIREILHGMEELLVSKEFKEELFKEIDSMAVTYPNYLKAQEMQIEELTDMEKRILHLYCEGITANGVCELCSFTYNTLKFHNRNIYKKLGVSNRIEAERVGNEILLK